MEIRRLRSGDERELEKVAPCFDHLVQPEAVTRFLASENHYILVAYEEDGVAGFVSGVAMTHPDKGTEMFLYELAVDEKFRRRGVGTKLVSALADMARLRGCYGMWVLTEEDNAAALATYSAAGGRRESTPVMLSWQF
jgi:ribosomal protein S18 acetylase RimI-like enzyme